jgi:tripartite-type tricarboxylate transporter receptor subunit TctC
MNMPCRHVLAITLGTFLSVAVHHAVAQSYPAKTVRVIDAFPPGGNNDVAMRILGSKLGPVFGQSVIVESRTGAAGNIGAEFVAKSPPDGYTLFIGSSITLAASAALYAKLPYDALRDFAPIVRVGTTPYLLASHPSLPVKSVKELIALAKARPRQLNVGTPGVGSASHLSSELFKNRAGVEITNVTYKGAALVLIGVMSGEVEIGFMGVTGAISPVQAGKLRALGVSSLKRSAVLPNVPAIAETLPGFEAVTTLALYAPAGTPAAIVNLWNAEVSKALAQSDVRERLVQAGVDASASSPEELAAVLNNEIAKWGKVIRAAGIRVE